MKEWFDIPKSQQKPAVFLIILLCIILLVRFSMDYFIKPSDEVMVYDTIGKFIPMDSLINLPADARHDSFFFFNPNTVCQSDLIAMGVPERTAETWIKFRSKGFVFRKPQDLEKIYGLRKELIKKLLPFVRIETTGTKTTPVFTRKKSNVSNDARNKNYFSSKNLQEEIDINQADSAVLEKLPMIGPVLARRIARYRSLLGGFVSKEQIKEVYGMKDENFNAVRNVIRVNPSFVPKKIRVMTDDFKTLHRHPYITYDMAKKIIQFRKKAGINADNICLVLESDSLCKIVLPYLSFE